MFSSLKVYKMHLGKHVGKLVGAKSWSRLWARQVQDFWAHMERQRLRGFTWYPASVLMQFYGAQWLGRARLAAGGGSVFAGRTGSRAVPGIVRARLETSVADARQYST